VYRQVTSPRDESRRSAQPRTALIGSAAHRSDRLSRAPL